MKRIIVILLGLILLMTAISVSAHSMQEDRTVQEDDTVQENEETTQPPTGHTNQDKLFDPHSNQDSVGPTP